MVEARCPSRDVLVRYLQGNFDLSEADSLEEHLEQCPACEETVAELEDTNDTLMRHLPLAAGAKVEAGAEAPAWIERLKGGPPAEKDGEGVVEEQREGVGTQWNEGLASYELLEVLGKGGMGVVYRGRHRQLGRPVAVKVVRPKLVSAGEAHRRFDREIQILGRLNHPGIVMATDAGRVGSAAYLVMELIDGVDLARLVRSGGPLDVGEACEVARQIAVALSAAHAAGAVHRDVKPSNAMIDAGGRVKLLDFGLASLVDLGDEHGETSLGRLIGTLDYMAPEQAEGKGVQAAADLYGLGATLFYLLAGRPPHATGANRTLLGQLKALSSEDPPRLSELRLDVPEELSDLVAELLARNPADRPATAAEVADRLAAWANPGAKVTLAGMIPTVDRTDDVPAAARSLAELVGGEPEVVASPAIEKVETAANGNGRRVGRWLLGLAGFAAAALLGIVLLVDTPEGTLRIESDAENVSIELIDEADRTKTVQIEEGENATQLRAGKYRIRLAGKHDNLSITPGAIELRRGEERVARITHVPPEVSEQGVDIARYAPIASVNNEELTHVAISVEYEDGRPAIGAEVTMEMIGQPARPVKVTGKSDATGVAFTRNLPYGRYEMTIEVPDVDGAYWTHSLYDILLEFGGRYEQTIVAPAPLERATVQVHSDFNPTGLKGLRFGSSRKRPPKHGGMDLSYTLARSPEPGQPAGELASFPVPGKGIANVALMMSVRTMREVHQPDGPAFEWHWNRQGDAGYWMDDLLLTDEGARKQGVDWGGDGAYEISRSEFFTSLPDDHGIQYFTFPTRGDAGNPLSVEFPPGKLVCQVSGLYGKADGKVIQALGFEPEDVREVWLGATLSNHSAWIPRAIDLTEWNFGKESESGILPAFKTLSLEPGGTHELRVASPDPSSLEEIAADDAEEQIAPTGGLPAGVPATQEAVRSEAVEPARQAVNDELTQVTISVEYEDGRPAVDAEVTMSMQGNPDRPVKVSGKADTKGVALNRNLPYGKYVMTIKVPERDGAYWTHASSDILLEFGGTYEQTIVAPTPEERATVKVDSAFDGAGLKGLRFGGYIVPTSSAFGSYTVDSSPEPGEQADRFADFPVLGSGVSEGAVNMAMSVTRHVKQSSGKRLNWYWKRKGGYDSYPLILTDKNIVHCRESTGDTAYKLQKSKYFSKVDEWHGVRYLTLLDTQIADSPLSLSLPPGDLEFELKAFWAKADGDVVEALGVDPSSGHEIWLEANLKAESAWVPRGIDLADWSRGTSMHTLAHKTLSLEPGETHELRVASPDPSSLEEIKEESGAESTTGDEE